MGRYIDLTGQRFGRLIVTGSVPNPSKTNRAKRWRCVCDCGNCITTRGDGLRSGRTVSCGCYREEQRLKAVTKHGGHNTRLYTAWNNMLSRCVYKNAKNNKDYGGRGISVCEEWLEFENFRDWAMANGYTDNLTIERKNVDGNYEPGNCTWVTAQEQMFNTRIPQDNKSGHKGVIYSKKSHKWYAFIVINRRQISLGLYDLYEDAVKSREDGERKYYKK